MQVRQAIEALLGTGTCGHRQVANALYMHPRTLQRRLKEEGTTSRPSKTTSGETWPNATCPNPTCP